MSPTQFTGKEEEEEGRKISSFFLGLEDGNFISDRKTFPPESTRCACAQSIRNLLLLLETTPDDLNGKKSADEAL